MLDKYGKPDDILAAVKNSREPLPHCPLTGMYNKMGGKVRLTFKLELDQLWLGTKGKFTILGCWWMDMNMFHGEDTKTQSF